MGMTNLIDGAIAGIDGKTVRVAASGYDLVGAWTGQSAPRIGQPAFLAIHPQRLAVDPVGEGWNRVDGHALTTAYKGAHTDITVDTPLGILTASVPPASASAARPRSASAGAPRIARSARRRSSL